MKRKIVAKMLVIAMTLSMAVPFCGTSVEAAKKPKLNVTKATVKVGKTKKLTIKNVKSKNIKSAVWKTNKTKIATVKKKGKTAAVVTAKKAGKANITCKVVIKGKKVSLRCVITVKKASTAPTTPSATPTVLPTTAPTLAPTAAPTEAPTATPVPTATPMGEVTPIKDTYVPILGQIGNCLSVSQLTNAVTLEYVKKHYTSFTLENEMKPDAILGSTATTITKAEAKADASKYVIPSNYNEALVPSLNFTKVDQALKIAYDNGLKVRAHTLVWHSQTPEWFFKTGFSGDGSYVSTTVMNARMEMYIRSVMNHVYSIEDGKYKNTVYAWDVVNEYMHNNADANWSAVYGNREGVNGLGNKPPYVKRAFEIAYDELVQFDLVGKVSLFNNDYNTYVDPESEIAIVEYINEGETAKICNGIGMQSHIDYDYPSAELYGETIGKFAAKGYEIQITEFDATINNLEGKYKQENQNNDDQAVYVSQIMNAVLAQKKAGANITGFTIWGLYDNISWRKSSKPTLFGKSITDVKPSYYAFMEAAKNY